MTFEEFCSELTELTPTPEDIEACKAEGTYFEHLPLTMLDKGNLDRLVPLIEISEVYKLIDTLTLVMWKRMNRYAGLIKFFTKHGLRLMRNILAIKYDSKREKDLLSSFSKRLSDRIIEGLNRVPDCETFRQELGQELVLYLYVLNYYSLRKKETSESLIILMLRYKEVTWLKKLDLIKLSFIYCIAAFAGDGNLITSFSDLLQLFDQDEQDGEMQEDVANLLDDLNMMREQGINAISVKQASIEYMIARGHIEIDNPEHKGNWKWWALIQVWAELAKAEGIHGMGYSYQDGGEVSPKGLNEEDREWINAEYGELYTDADSGVIKTRLARNKEWRKFYYDIEPPHDELVQLCEEIRKNAFFDTLS